ncbi:MAG TPA: hypothetical protein VG028_16735 [Terriglobia bacterium]|nr:hypothetical protein [Terriglobia bacterium]
MNANRKLASLFAVALAATVLSAGSAFAQGLSTVQARGKFTLPFEAHWGLATLPAGQYTFEMGHNMGDTTLVELRSEGKGRQHAIILTMAQQQSPAAKTSELVCIRQGNTGIVRSLVLATLGETIYFSIPRNEQILARTSGGKTPTLVAEGPELIQRIHVEAAGE